MVNDYPSIIDGEIYHFGIEGMKWHKRRYQNEDGSLTPAGKIRYAKKLERVNTLKNKSEKNALKSADAANDAANYRAIADQKRYGGLFGLGINNAKAKKFDRKFVQSSKEAARYNKKSVKQNYKADHIVKRLNKVYGAIKVKDLDNVTLSRAKQYGIYLNEE